MEDIRYYIDLADTTVRRITRKRPEWIDFLNTVSNIYKYPFYDQIMIYAQKPNAMACADVDIWNDRFSRVPKSDAKAIKLIDPDTSEGIKSVYDISDTVQKTVLPIKPVRRWELKTEHVKTITESFEDSYGYAGKGVSGSLWIISKQLTEEYYSEHKDDIIRDSAGSSLEPPVAYDEFEPLFNTQVDDRYLADNFCKILENSVTYIVLKRCGYDPLELLDDELFSDITLFNSSSIVNQLGVAINSIANQILHEIELSIREYNQHHKTDRRVRDDGNRRQTNGIEQMGNDAEELPENPSESTIQRTDVIRRTEQPLSGRTGSGGRAAGTDTETVTGARNTERMGVGRTTYIEPGEIQGEIQQPETHSRRDSDKRTGLRIKNYRITDATLGEGGAKAKFKANAEAIKTLKAIESENRSVTREEQEILAKYVGWGGLPQAFDGMNSEWAKEYTELKTLLTEDEYASARASTLNAHYTSPTVIKAIYDAIVNMGFKDGNVLEPSCGVGNFFGMLPDTMSGSRLHGVELDSVTARIAAQLYPEADIKHSGYENVDYPNAFFDLAIGNVPFGNFGVFDKNYKTNFFIHDYFFQKTLDKVRPGGIIAFVTSMGTMDKQSQAVRKYIAERAELLGAIRLPNTAFRKNAGTDVTADIIFLKKRDGIAYVDEKNTDWLSLGMAKTSEHIDCEERLLGAKDAFNEFNKQKTRYRYLYPDATYDADSNATSYGKLSVDGSSRYMVELNGLRADVEKLENELSIIEVKAILVNKYFTDNPDMILGTMTTDSGSRMYGREDAVVCVPTEGEDLAERLQVAIKHIKGEYTQAEHSDIEGVDTRAIPADIDVKNFSYTVKGDTLYYRENSLMYPVDTAQKTIERIKGMVAVRDSLYSVIDAQVNSEPDLSIKDKQSELERHYDAFTRKHGLISDTANSSAFSDDNSYALIASLEVLDEEGNFSGKADIFTERTIIQKPNITHVDTAAEALAVSLSEKAAVDLEFMSELANMEREQIIDDLKGLVYQLPYTDDYVTADEYLSGNIRLKLQKAIEYQDTLPNPADYAHNVEALRAVMPKELEANEISVKLGSPWVDKEYIQEFMYELLAVDKIMRDFYKVEHHAATNSWEITGKNRDVHNNFEASVQYGTMRMNAYRILDCTLNLRDAEVYDTVEDPDGGKRQVLNPKETVLAQQKQETIKQKFRDWIWSDADRRTALVKKYNEIYNSIRPREYDGSHLTFPGMTAAIELKKHQIDGVARHLYGGNALLAHTVGAGKTFTMVAAAMESKRLGLSNKSLFVVPNHLTEQWGAEFLRLYPSANVLVAREKDFEKRNWKRFSAKIATGNYDAIIIGHSKLVRIPMSKERHRRLLEDQINDIQQGLESLQRSGNRFTIKQLEKAKRGIENRLKKLVDTPERDEMVTFEQLGVDRLFLDEAHKFKNLYLHTKMQNVAGISTDDAQKTSDLYMKTRYLDEMTGYKGVVFATGTPISNSMTELYTMQRYLQYDKLEELGIAHFDAWAASFGETVTAVELAPDGNSYRAKSRFARFFNLPELMSMFKETADIQTDDMIDLPVPEAEFMTVVAEASDIQKEMVEKLSERAEKISRGKVNKTEDNMLVVTSDGRKIGLDQRTQNPLLPDNAESKVNQCIGNIYRIWEETKANKLTQLVFCDLSTPKDSIGSEFDFIVYNDIKGKLIKKGIPENEIAFIHDANSSKKKIDLFKEVRKGNVRVLLGSTEKMGMGTNVQDRLVALHDLDCPWRPADLEQRAGRIIRQGNKNDKVYIYRYVTNGTFDSYLWQTVERKQKFISQIMTSKTPVRSCDDIDETALSYAEIKALAAGNPLIAEKMALDIEVSKLQMMKSDHQSQKFRAEDDLYKHLPAKIKRAESRIENIRRDMDAYDAARAKMTTVNELGKEDIRFSMEIKGVIYEKRAEAGQAIIDSVKNDNNRGEEHLLGKYMGFDLFFRNASLLHDAMLIIRGQASYFIAAGADPSGNITRINNELERLPSYLEEADLNLKSHCKDVETAKLVITRQFEKEGELAEVLSRQAEINAKLNINDSGVIIEQIKDVAYDVGDFLETTNEDGEVTKWVIAMGDDYDPQGCYRLIAYDAENNYMKNTIAFIKSKLDYSIAHGEISFGGLINEKIELTPPPDNISRLCGAEKNRIIKYEGCKYYISNIGSKKMEIVNVGNSEDKVYIDTAKAALEFMKYAHSYGLAPYQKKEYYEPAIDIVISDKTETVNETGSGSKNGFSQGSLEQRIQQRREEKQAAINIPARESVPRQRERE